ncbi:hypothetical protein ACN23B_17020 [Anabaena sp. FACHB-709]|uniref:Uncharacterized protein n=2 Tax=Nostocaceae TaxID=1162 RepID=A0A1Z4KJ55_ANAVA|nr:MULTISPECIES: hypothetical protein [Nostocaceae]BAY69019.1 hypothetical protein NIES23_18100 [Trichormus variabilis NIES-23]HBW30242.1 hypothetical protein [Nostoc sp. UBA8866]MBD2173806.1 hypothetical protein [Anabaena cylindrica FACHB-318]MBD2265631.1 hypothetical protein [Anabaena sp. FACHB-709]MBD2274846.1 hypothetical protein [Nostoc sp. PCC 7120 = FACHB-418]
MAAYEFHDEYTLAETADKLGKKALQLNLIPSFVVRYFADSRQYYIPDEIKSESLTPEEAYMRFRKLLEDSGN